jgi:hypothetical protein
MKYNWKCIEEIWFLETPAGYYNVFVIHHIDKDFINALFYSVMTQRVHGWPDRVSSKNYKSIKYAKLACQRHLRVNYPLAWAKM